MNATIVANFLLETARNGTVFTKEIISDLLCPVFTLLTQMTARDAQKCEWSICGQFGQVLFNILKGNDKWFNERDSNLINAVLIRQTQVTKYNPPDTCKAITTALDKEMTHFAPINKAGLMCFLFNFLSEMTYNKKENIYL